MRSTDHLIIFLDSCGGENKNKNVCAFLRVLLKSNVWPNLKKINLVFMEIALTKFTHNAGFGLIRRWEKVCDTETMKDMEEMVSSSTQNSGRNIGHIFNSKNFKKWNHHHRFLPIPNIRQKHLIQFYVSNNSVLTRSREGYSGKWTSHGTTLKRNKSWPESIEEDLIDKPVPPLKPARVFHIRKQVLPQVSEKSLPWWDSIAPIEVSNQYAHQKKEITRKMLIEIAI